MSLLGGSLGLRVSSPLPSGSRLPPSPKGDGFFSGSCFAVAGVGALVVGQSRIESEFPPSVACRRHLPPRGTALALVLFECLAYNRHKESTHSIVWMPRIGLSVFMDTAYSVGRQSRLFYFAQFFL